MKKTIALLSVLLLAGCTALHAPPAQDAKLYLLNAHVATLAAPAGEKVIAVAMPQARPGYDTPQMAYVQRPHALEYFALNRWVDTPAHMLAPLLAEALQRRGGFRAVVSAADGVPADLRLDTEIVRLQQDFQGKPSRIELTLRAQLVDLHRDRVLASRVFDVTEPAPSDDPYGGVIAANRALQRVFEQLSAFCQDAPASQ